MSRATYATKEFGGQATKTAARATTGNLRIGPPDDVYEREADRVADEVMAGSFVKQWSLSSVPVNAPVQRKCSCGSSGGSAGKCEECKKREEGQPTLQRKASDESEATPEFAPPIVHQALNSPSQRLDPALRTEMTERLGFDFAKVRVHADSASAQSAREVGADAYTIGQDVVFAAGRYAPGTSIGRRLIAHELVHVAQQSDGADRGTLRPSLLQRQEAADAPKKLTVEEYKKLSPSIQALTWGPDFIQGFKKSGAASQVGDAAMVVIEQGFTQSMEHPIVFRTGVMLGIPLGEASAVWSNLKSLAELGWELTKLFFRLQVTPRAVAQEVIDVVKNNAPLLLAGAEPLGNGVGQMVAKDATKFALEFVNSSPLDQGLTFGKIIGRITGEIALLFIGLGEVSAAAKFAANTRYGRMLLEAMEASRLLKPLVESTEAAKAARAAKAAEGEAAAVGRAAKAAEEARPGVAAAEDAPKTAPKPSQPGERPPVAGVKDALPTSVSKEVITPNEAVAEAEFIDAHPETIVSETPPRAKLGDHEVVQLPEGVCERHSKKVPIPCPGKFKKKAPQPKPSMLTKEPGEYLPDFQIGRNMDAADLAYENKIRKLAGGPPDQGYYVKGAEGYVQFEAFDRKLQILVDAKNWRADGKLVKALEAGEHWAAWKVVKQAHAVGSSRVDLQACKLEYSIVSPK